MKAIDSRHFITDLYKAVLLIGRASPFTAVGSFVLLSFQSLLPVASLYFIKLLIELIIQQDKILFEQVLPVIIGFCVIQLLTSFATQLSGYINTIQQQKVADHLSALVLEKAASVSFEYYEDSTYHDTLHLAQQQSQFRIVLLLGNLNTLLLNILSLFFLAALLLVIHWSYALLFIGLALPVSFIKWYYGFRLFQLEKKTVGLEREAAYLHQTLTSVTYAKEARLLGYAKTFIQKFKNIRHAIYDAKRKIQVTLTCYSLLADTIEIIVVSFIFCALAKNTLEKTITVGVFVVYLQGFQKLQTSAKNLLQSLVQIVQQRLFVRDLFVFLALPSPDKNRQTASLPGHPKTLLVENISFTYPGTTRPVLKNISIRCPQGKIIAIVGENGCGKSTLVKLLGRLYDVQQGRIEIDGISLATIQQQEFQLRMAFLFQDFEKFFFTVEENIMLGSHQADSERMMQASLLSGSDTFINTLSKNYQTRLGRTFAESEQLSGGQWQKLSLARVFYKNAPVVVLDEPTSSIDALAEYTLFENLKTFAQDKIVVLISHRLYNIKIADYIYVMEGGSIIEEGSFGELVEKDGLFRKMYAKQKLD